ncbi:DNA polymerase IV 2 [Nymphon striatum]|nr:DNA polymerase IV 2 [Nymphon striatum]
MLPQRPGLGLATSPNPCATRQSGTLSTILRTTVAGDRCANVCSMVSRTILHADLDAFYASVEQRDDPALRDRPMMVGGGVVLSASYEARRMGVRTAMSGAQARRLCPTVIEVPPRMEAYSQASKDVFAIFDDTTPEVEAMSIDEAFLDVTGLHRLVGPGQVVAARLRARVFDEVGLPISVGCASTKFLAKVASTVSKPDGLLVVEPGRELEFLHPLPIERLWGVGPATAERLRSKGMTHVRDVAAANLDDLMHYLGKAAGRHLHGISNNIDQRKVDTGKRRRSIGSQRSFPRGGLQRQESEAVLLEVIDRVTNRLRSADRVARTVVLRLRFGDFKSATRSRTLPQATNSTAAFHRTAKQLLDEVWAEAEERGLTRVGISVTNLTSAHAIQLAMDFDGGAPPELDSTIDRIRDRFGTEAIGRAALVNRDTRTVPLLPD